MSEEILYTAAKNSLAADASTENCWSLLVRDSKELRGSIYKDTKEAIIAMEFRIKEEYKMEVMPNAWRSAKSVLLGALKLGLPLEDENGVFFGKSAMQRLIREAKESVAIEKTPYQLVITHLDKARNLIHHLTKDEQRAIRELAGNLCS